MASETQIFSREMILSAYKAALQLSRTLYKSTLFMQNKANSKTEDSKIMAKDKPKVFYNCRELSTNQPFLCKTNPIFRMSK